MNLLPNKKGKDFRLSFRNNYLALIAIFLLFTTSISAQTFVPYEPLFWKGFQRVIVDSSLTLPKGIAARRLPSAKYDTGQIRYNMADSSVYISTGSQWRKVGPISGGGGSQDLQSVTDIDSTSSHELIIQGARLASKGLSNYWGIDAGQGDSSTYSVGIGYGALTFASGTQNVGIGVNAGQGVIGNGIIGIGRDAAIFYQGYRGVFVGDNSGDNGVGYGNVGIGADALTESSSNHVTAVGDSAGHRNTFNDVSIFGYNAYADSTRQVVLSDGVHQVRLDHGNLTSDIKARWQDRDGTIAYLDDVSGGGSGGTVTTVSRTNGYGISASVANASTTPNITISLDSGTVFAALRATIPSSSFTLTNGNGTTANSTAVDLGGAVTANIPLTPGTHNTYNLYTGLSGNRFKNIYWLSEEIAQIGNANVSYYASASTGYLLGDHVVTGNFSKNSDAGYMGIFGTTHFGSASLNNNGTGGGYLELTNQSGYGVNIKATNVTSGANRVLESPNVSGTIALAAEDSTGSPRNMVYQGADGLFHLAAVPGGSAIDTGRGIAQIPTGYQLNKVRDSVQANIGAKMDTLSMGVSHLAADFTTSSTTAVNTGLSFYAAANTSYKITIVGTASKATSSSGMKLAIGAPSGCTVKGFAQQGGSTLSSALTNSLITAINTLGSTFATGTGVEVVFRIEATVNNGSTAGLVTLDAATVTSNVATIYAQGTSMQWHKSTAQ